MKHYRKCDVQTHSDRRYGAQYPAVNVKVYRFPSVYDVQALFPESDEETLRTALQYAFDSACECFWEDWMGQDELDFLDFYFPGAGARISCTRRSGGWLIVQGIGAVEDWDCIALSRWRRFEKAVTDDVRYRTSLDSIIASIAMNQWHKPLSAKYNFFDTPDGTPVCVADARAELRAEAERRYGNGGLPLVPAA